MSDRDNRLALQVNQEMHFLSEGEETLKNLYFQVISKGESYADLSDELYADCVMSK